MIDEIECPACDGHGPADCTRCHGDGWCPPTYDEIADMAERQAEDAATGEPPVTMQEQYIDAWTMKQALRR